jgi:hypothetical protein
MQMPSFVKNKVEVLSNPEYRQNTHKWRGYYITENNSLERAVDLLGQTFPPT